MRKPIAKIIGINEIKKNGDFVEFFRRDRVVLRVFNGSAIIMTPVKFYHLEKGNLCVEGFDFYVECDLEKVQKIDGILGDSVVNYFFEEVQR